jgi:hypothetical protein
MVYYRLYVLHGPKNEVESFREFSADGDASAIAMAEKERTLNPMELWSGHRKVHRWEASDPQILISPTGRKTT